MGSGPRVPIWHPHAAHLLAREGPVLGQFGRADRTPNLRPKPGGQEGQTRQRSPGHAHPPDPSVPTTGFQLVGVRRAQPRTLNMLFDTTSKDAWKVLFKGAEAPASATEDRGFCARR